MKEGSTEAPTRHAIPWEDPDWYDAEKLEKEMHRVFDICHGCRRCFNLCDSFPRLFDMVDSSPTGELDGVDPKDYGKVVDACTLCDMCFMTKCPYVPPHAFDLDFPHLMLRWRAAERKRGEVGLVRRQLARTDLNGRLAGLAAGLANWATDEKNHTTRNMLEDVAGIHHEAALPKYHARTMEKQARSQPVEVNRQAPAFGRKAVIYATCFGNYNNPAIGLAARAVLAKNGVETEVLHPRCCGMPLLEQGAVDEVAAAARTVAEELGAWIDRGYEVIAPIPSCGLMLKFEWPLVLPGDPAVKRLSENTSDICEYIVDIARKEGLAPGLGSLPAPVTLQLACHARAQNMGPKGAEMLRLIPDSNVQVIERCSGHGGAWGIMKENFEIAIKTGRPVARQARKVEGVVASECPLAAEHIRQGMERIEGDGPVPPTAVHPILLFAEAYGIRA